MSARILVVDDYQVARSTIPSLLTWHFMHVCGEAEDGKQAVEKVRELHPDLVLFDVNMPVMKGVQAAYEIRRSPSTTIIFFHDPRLSERRLPPLRVTFVAFRLVLRTLGDGQTCE